MVDRGTFKILVLTIGLFCIALMLWPQSTTLAVLGGEKESVEIDRQKMSGNRETEVRQQYTVETIQGAGLAVQEYVSPTGTIFAVSWKGNRIPDLSSLFGTYYSEYKQVLEDWRKSVPHRRGPLHLESTHLIIETGGHSPRLWGRALVPSLFPSGVSQEEIR